MENLAGKNFVNLWSESDLPFSFIIIKKIQNISHESKLNWKDEFFSGVYFKVFLLSIVDLISQNWKCLEMNYNKY